MNHVSWSVVILNAPRGKTSEREREVLSTSKLSKNEKDESKTAKNVAGANMSALENMDVPVDHIDYCCSNTTSYNSSLNLPQDMGGSGGKGGAYAHIWSHFRSKGHILFFFNWCLSHLGGNEVQHVMKEAGACEEDTKRLVKKGTTTSERWRMVEHLTDVRHAIVSTAGCLDYLCWVEERSSIPSPPGGSTTRWKYWLDEAEYLQPAHERYDHVLTFLLHTWLIDEGHDGILAGEEGEGKGGDDTL